MIKQATFPSGCEIVIKQNQDSSGNHKKEYLPRMKTRLEKNRQTTRNVNSPNNSYKKTEMPNPDTNNTYMEARIRCTGWVSTL